MKTHQSFIKRWYNTSKWEKVSQERSMGSKMMIGVKSDNWFGVNSDSPINEKKQFQQQFILVYCQENEISLPMQSHYWFNLVCMAQKRISKIKLSELEAFVTKILCIRKPLSSLSKFSNFYKKGMALKENVYSYR